MLSITCTRRRRLYITTLCNVGVTMLTEGLGVQEIDYKLEGQNADRFRRNFADQPWIKVLTFLSSSLSLLLTHAAHAASCRFANHIICSILCPQAMHPVCTSWIDS